MSLVVGAGFGTQFVGAACGQTLPPGAFVDVLPAEFAGGVSEGGGHVRAVPPSLDLNRAAMLGLGAELVVPVVEHVLRCGRGVHASSRRCRLARSAPTRGRCGSNRSRLDRPSMRCLSGPELRKQITAITNKAEAFHGYSEWLMVGGRLTGHSDPDHQELVVKFNELIANCAICSTALDITDAANAFAADGNEVDHDDLATVTPYPPTLSAGSATWCSTSTRPPQRRPPAWTRNHEPGFPAVRPPEPQISTGPSRAGGHDGHRGLPAQRAGRVPRPGHPRRGSRVNDRLCGQAAASSGYRVLDAVWVLRRVPYQFALALMVVVWARPTVVDALVRASNWSGRWTATVRIACRAGQSVRAQMCG